MKKSITIFLTVILSMLLIIIYYIGISDENTPDGHEAAAAVSKIGGNIIWYMDPVLSNNDNISKKNAIKKRKIF